VAVQRRAGLPSALPLQGELGEGLEATTGNRSDRRMARACERPDRYHLRRRRLGWGRFRVRVRGVLPWKRLFASLSRSRNLSPAVLLRFLAIFNFLSTRRQLGAAS